MTPRALPLLLTVAACGPSPVPDLEPAIVDVPDVRPERMFATWEQRRGRALLGAFDGALLPGSAWSVRDSGGAVVGRGVADADGRLEIPFDGSPGSLVAVVSEQDEQTEIAFRVRDPEAATARAVRAPIGGAGSVPNDLIVVGSPEVAQGVLVRSGDNAVSTFDLERGLDAEGLGVRLPEVSQPSGVAPATPWFVAPLDQDGRRVAVTAFDQARVYLVDLEQGRVEQTLPMQGQVVLDAPFALARPFDVNADGVVESSVTRFGPRSPQAVLAAAGRLFVTFSSFLSPRLDDRRGPVYLPGVLAMWRLDEPDRPPRLFPLPFQVPQELRWHPEVGLLVVCSGVIDHLGGRVAPLTPGGLVVFDPEAETISMSLEMPDFAAGTALVAADAFWVGSLLSGVVRRVDLRDPSRVEDIPLTDELEVDSIFRLVALPGGLIAAPSFNSDRLFIIDPRMRAVSPPPFFHALRVGAGPPVFDGLQIVAVRPGRPGVDFVGPDLFALSGLSSKVTPVELRKILGP